MNEFSFYSVIIAILLVLRPSLTFSFDSRRRFS